MLFNGTASPRVSVNLYNISVHFLGGGCLFGTSTLTGIGYYDSANRQLYAAAPNGSRTDGFLFVGTSRRDATMGFLEGLLTGAAGAFVLSYRVARSSLREARRDTARVFISAWVPRVAQGLDPSRGGAAERFHNALKLLLDSVEVGTFDHDGFESALFHAQHWYAEWKKRPGSGARQFASSSSILPPDSNCGIATSTLRARARDHDNPELFSSGRGVRFAVVAHGVINVVTGASH